MFHKKPLPHPTSPQKDNSRQKKETQLLRRTKGMKKRTLIWVHLQIIPSFSTFVAASSSCNTAVNIPLLQLVFVLFPYLIQLLQKSLTLRCSISKTTHLFFVSFSHFSPYQNNSFLSQPKSQRFSNCPFSLFGWRLSLPTRVSPHLRLPNAGTRQKQPNGRPREQHHDP